jgi:hypothetical protein
VCVENLVNFFLCAPSERIRVCLVEDNVFVAQFANVAVARFVAAVGSRQVRPFELAFHLTMADAQRAAAKIQTRSPVPALTGHRPKHASINSRRKPLRFWRGVPAVSARAGLLPIPPALPRLVPAVEATAADQPVARTLEGSRTPRSGLRHERRGHSAPPVASPATPIPGDWETSHSAYESPPASTTAFNGPPITPPPPPRALIYKPSSPTPVHNPTPPTPSAWLVPLPVAAFAV